MARVIHLYMHLRRSTADWKAKDSGEELIGKIVKFKVPGPGSISGTVKRAMPDGRFEIKSQQHGYYLLRRQEFTVHDAAAWLSITEQEFNAWSVGSVQNIGGKIYKILQKKKEPTINMPGTYAFWVKAESTTRDASSEEKALYDFLIRFWQLVGSDIYGAVTNNRSAVEVLVDRAFDKMTPEQRALLNKLGMNKISANVKVF